MSVALRPRAYRSRRFWTSAEISLLRSMYPHCHTADVAAFLDRPPEAIYSAAKSYAVAKTDDYLTSVTAGRIQRGRMHPAMVATQFKRGVSSWNKGTKGLVGVQEGCRATQFKKGRLPQEARNYLPIGSYRICADGYLERKFTDDPKLMPARRWVGVHREVWEAANGAIPSDHIVRFRPGLKTTVLEEITVDRLECITRAEHARRNHPRNISPELAKLVQLKGAITRQVKRIAREAQEQQR